MSRTVRFYLVVAAVIVAAVPAGLLPAVSAGASTAACGSACTSPSVASLGTGEVLEVSGSNVVMAAASSTNSGEDWTPVQEGDVANAVAAAVVSVRLTMLYSTDQLVEFEYAPNGVPSDQCLSDTFNVSFAEPTLTVALAQCGLTAQSLWILDAGNEANGYVDLINAGYSIPGVSYPVSDSGEQNYVNEGYSSPFAEPYVLTVNSSGKVVLAPLSQLGSVVSTSQLWASWSAPAQPALRAMVAKLRARGSMSR